MWVLSSLRDPFLWESFTIVIRKGKWRQRLQATQQFNAINLALTKRVLFQLYGPAYGTEKIVVQFIRSLLGSEKTGFLVLLCLCVCFASCSNDDSLDDATLDLGLSDVYYYWDRFLHILGILSYLFFFFSFLSFASIAPSMGSNSNSSPFFSFSHSLW